MDVPLYHGGEEGIKTQNRSVEMHQGFCDAENVSA